MNLCESIILYVFCAYLITVTAIDRASGRFTVSKWGTRAMLTLDLAKSMDLISFYSLHEIVRASDIAP